MNLKRGPMRGLQKTVSVEGRCEEVRFVSGAFRVVCERGRARVVWTIHTSVPVYESTGSDRIQRTAFVTCLAADVASPDIKCHVNTL